MQRGFGGGVFRVCMDEITDRWMMMEVNTARKMARKWDGHGGDDKVGAWRQMGGTAEPC